MNSANLPPGVYIEFIAPLSPLPTDPAGIAEFDVSFQIVISEEQNLRLKIQVAAYNLDQAAQIAFGKVAATLTGLGKIAKDTSDRLLAKLPKP